MGDACSSEAVGETAAPMKTTVVAVGLALGVLVLAVIGGSALVLLAYGVGQVLNLVMHLQPFEATLLSLIGICLAALVFMRLVSVFVYPFFSGALDEAEDWEAESADPDADLDEEGVEPGADYYPGVPRWRQPLKRTDFSHARPEEACPCGSGRPYKLCHGRNRKV
jgi:hypothetical protein